MAIELILTPFPIDTSTCILDPFRSLSARNNVANPFFLDQAAGYFPLFGNPTVIFDQPPMIRTWPWTAESDNYVEWRKWSYRVEKTYGQQWKNTYIYDLINFYQHGIFLDTNLLAAASCLWSKVANVFCFPYSPMSPTMLDISALMGLPIFGDEVTPCVSSPVAAQFKLSKSKDKTYGGSSSRLIWVSKVQSFPKKNMSAS